MIEFGIQSMWWHLSKYTVAFLLLPIIIISGKLITYTQYIFLYIVAL